MRTERRRIEDLSPPPPPTTTSTTHATSAVEPARGRDAAITDIAAAEGAADSTRVGAFRAELGGSSKAVSSSKDAGPVEPVTAEPAALVPDADTLTTRVEAHLDGAGGRAMGRDLEALAPSFGVPAGGFPGQTNLYGEGGVPVAWYTLRGNLGTSGDRSEVSARSVEHLSDGLGRAARVTDDPALVMAVTMREHPSAWTASSGRIETFSEGGLDYMGDHLGEFARSVPRDARTGPWRRAEPFISGETGAEVRPAEIPAADQLVAYAAELERAEAQFETMVHEVYGDDADAALASLSEDDRRAWIQFTFGRPGRTHASDYEISDRHFSANAALELLHSEGRTDLGAILDDARFGDNASVRRARTTAMEARWLDDHLLAE